jgi:hypothetical protein
VLTCESCCGVVWFADVFGCDSWVNVSSLPLVCCSYCCDLGCCDGVEEYHGGTTSCSVICEVYTGSVNMLMVLRCVS